MTKVKKCGNCGHGCYESTVYCQVYNEDILVDNDACDEWVDPKEHHIRCDAYEQLAEITVSMLGHVEGSREFQVRKDGKKLKESRMTYQEYFGNKLRDLGIGIDV